MYRILARDSSAGPSAAGARCRTRLRWHFSGRRSAGPGGYPDGLPRQGRFVEKRLRIVRRSTSVVPTRMIAIQKAFPREVRQAKPGGGEYLK